MEKEITLSINFSSPLSENELNDFWESLIDEIEEMDLRAGGGIYSHRIEWVIDYSTSKIGKSEIIDRIIGFLKKRDAVILSFKLA